MSKGSLLDCLSRYVDRAVHAGQHDIAELARSICGEIERSSSREMDRRLFTQFQQAVSASDDNLPNA
jgi:hypothetical protein